MATARTIWLATMAVAFSFGTLARAPMTYEGRVKAQEALERVYYNHRIWPKENPQPKPPFEQMAPKVQIEAKVTDYLKKSAALEEFWQRPIQPEQLQAEMDRMAKGTKDPATLKELFAALNHDPYLIAECLARPTLADRLLRNWYANDERFHGDTKTKAEAALDSAGGGSLSLCSEGQYQKVAYVLSTDGEETDPGARTPQSPIAIDAGQFQRKLKESPEEGAPAVMRETPGAFILVRTALKTPSRLELELLAFPKRDLDEWMKGADLDRFIQRDSSTGYDFAEPAISTLACGQDGWSNGILGDMPDPRTQHTAVWTGTEMIVWGGSCIGYVNTGGRYNPSTDTWAATSTGANVPSGRYYHTAVWTGTEMIVWGGYDVTSNYVSSGGRYNPSTDTWTATAMGGACPTARLTHTAVWTGTRMIIWGGYNSSYVNTGGQYDPSADSWTKTSTGTNCPALRGAHTAVWTGTRMIVWGGAGASGNVNSGGLYNASANSWATTSTGTNCPSARDNHTAIWTGTVMIIWGGNGGTNTGGRYNPSSNTWTTTSTGTNCPSMREFHTAVWTGTEMIIWGGYSPTNTGGRYNPSTDTWIPTSTGANCPSAREYPTAVWTGSEMIIWGGDTSSSPLNTGGRYDPTTDTWVPTSMGPANSPSAREYHTATWTGSEMITWGGHNDTSYLNTGGRYAPAIDTWTPTSTGTNCPASRQYHTVVWTGSEMIIWGGYGNGFFTAGGRYNPFADTWTPTSTGTNCPSGRWGHTAIWTGAQMIVWGGNVNTGGRYDPSSDTWMQTSTGTYCPSARQGATGVWTGTGMVIWGGCYWDGYYTYLNTGGLYNPLTDTWTPTSTGANCPWARANHTAVWTGSEMVVWGGWVSGYANTGGVYNPSTDRWTQTSTGANCPSAREYHTAVWTGTEMIIWGGIGLTNTGGRYSPSNDSWLPTSTTEDCPLGRGYHTAVWTGTGMIVWGGYGGAYLGSGGEYFLGLPSEVPNTSLLWGSTGKDSLSWSSSTCATGYRVYRGDPTQLANLPTGAAACRAYDGTNTTTGAILDSDPDAGSFYWYLAVPYDSAGEGSAGEGNIILSSGTCTPP